MAYYKIALAQTTSTVNPEDNLIKGEAYVEKAARSGAVLTIFPEYFMNYYPEKNYVKKAESLSGPFTAQMKQLAKKYEMWLIFGMNQQSFDTEKSYNTMVVLNDQGEISDIYQKTHLFDAFSWKESKDTVAGERFMTPVDTPAGKIAIGTCYDLRFPEVARIAAFGGAQIMCYPSAWVRGKAKFMQWETLLRARAVENQIYVLGCCHYSEKHYMGQSTGFGPDGQKLYQGGTGEELLIAEINLEKIKEVRQTNPALDNCRTDLYTGQFCKNEFI